MINKMFRPVGATVNIVAATTTANVQRTGSGAPSPVAVEVRFYNAGVVPVFVNFGGSGVTATLAAGMPIAPGATEAFGLEPSQTHVAAITASGTATLYITTGDGL